jgi:hypothetical protein
LTTTDTKPNPLGQLLGGLMGKQTSVDVKPKTPDNSIHIEISGVDQKIALKHIRNLIDEMIQNGSSNRQSPD